MSANVSSWKDRIPVRQTRIVLATLAIGAAGAVIAAFLHFPAAFLTGPLIAVTIAGFAGLELDVPVFLRHVSFIVIGMVMGSGVSPATLEAARQWPLSFIGLIFSVALVMVTGWAMLARIWKLDSNSALLAATPGHLSYVFSLASETRSDTLAIGMIQSLRLLALTLLVPFTLAGMGLSSPDSTGSIHAMSLPWLLINALLATVAGWLFLKARVPAAFLMAGLLIATLSHITGIAVGAVPQWLSVPCFVILGSLIGTRFSNVSWVAFRRSAGAAVAVTVSAFAISFACALAVARVTGLDPKQVLLAYAPGGLETMAAIAVNMHIDPAYVASHHVFRLFILLALIPLFVKTPNSNERKGGSRSD
ncbi:AbrB family transcriptional regulator [Hoeflea sp. CAU 1731]